jgi:hypothetical protein
MAKKSTVGRNPNPFREMGVERPKSCENILALCEELGVHRRQVHKRRDQSGTDRRFLKIQPRWPGSTRQSMMRRTASKLTVFMRKASSMGRILL